MQCMMKEICAQCLQPQRDPATGKIRYVFSCFNQDQPLDAVDFGALRARLEQNVVQEKLTAQWVAHCLVRLMQPSDCFRKRKVSLQNSSSLQRNSGLLCSRNAHRQSRESVIESPIDIARIQTRARAKPQDRFAWGGCRATSPASITTTTRPSTQRLLRRASRCGSWEACAFAARPKELARDRAATGRRDACGRISCRVWIASFTAPASAGSRPTGGRVRSDGLRTAGRLRPPRRLRRLHRSRRQRLPVRHDGRGHRADPETCGTTGTARTCRPRRARNRGAAIRRSRVAAKQAYFLAPPPTRSRRRPVRRLRPVAVRVALDASRRLGPQTTRTLIFGRPSMWPSMTSPTTTGPTFSGVPE